MASILILSNKNEGIPLGIRLSQEGHLCKIYIKETQERSLLRGFKNPTLVLDPTRLLEQFDMVICSSTGLGDLAEECKLKGKITLGGVFNDKLELDEQYTNAVISTLLKVPIKIPTTEAISVSTTGWFNGTDFTLKYHSFKYDKFMEHNKGLDVIMGCAVLSCKEDKLYEETLKPLIPLLTKVKYLGPLTMNVVCFPEDKVFISFNSSIDISFYPYLELLKCSTWELLYRHSIATIVRDTDIALSCVLSIPPFPYNLKAPVRQTEDFISIPSPAKSHSFLLPETDGFIGYITARGESSNEARRRLYRTVNNSVINNNIQYRSDIGYGIEDKINQLKKWSWLS